MYNSNLGRIITPNYSHSTTTNDTYDILKRKNGNLSPLPLTKVHFNHESISWNSTSPKRVTKIHYLYKKSVTS